MKVIGILFLLLFPVTAFAAQDPQISRLHEILAQSAAAYESVRDYRAVFYKQEESAGKMGPREKIFLKFEKPFKIFMHWMDTRKKGLQVLYERGKRDGKLAVHQPGLLFGLAQVVYLDQNSPWVREGSESYDIEDAGIGTFLRDFAKMVRAGTEQNKIRAQVSLKPEGQEVDVSFPGSTPDGDYFASRTQVLFDARTRLPVRMSLYGWDGKLTGVYEYQELNLNIGADDSEFKRIAERHLYKLYLPNLPKNPSKTNFSARAAS